MRSEAFEIEPDARRATSTSTASRSSSRSITTDAQGEPTGESLSAALVKQVDNARAGSPSAKSSASRVATDPKTGRASLGFRVDDPQGGRYLVRVAGTDRFGNPIVADRVLTISGKKDETKLRLLADRQRYKVGEEASVNLHSRDRAGTALLTWEADRILSYKIVTLKEGDNPIAWADRLGPVPELHAHRHADVAQSSSTRPSSTSRSSATCGSRSRRPSRPSARASRSSSTSPPSTSSAARSRPSCRSPWSISRCCGSIDDSLPAIGPFFYNQTRTGAFATEATNTFRYAPATVPVSQAVVDEAERMAAIAANAGRSSANQVNGQARIAGCRACPCKVICQRRSVVRPHLRLHRHGRCRLPRGLNCATGRRNEQMGQDRSKLLGDGSKARRARLQTLDGVAEGRDIKFAEEFKDASILRDGCRARLAPRAIRRDCLLEPARRDRQGRQGARHVQGAHGPVGVSHHGPRASPAPTPWPDRRPRRLTVRKNFFVDLKVPGSLTQGDKPRFIAQVHHTGCRGQARAAAGHLRRGTRRGLSQDARAQAGRSRRGHVRALRGPRGDSIRLTLTGTVGDARDELVVEVPVRPWGVQVVASDSGTSSESTTIFVGLPAGRTYESPEMLIVLSPTLERMLIELALGEQAFLRAGSEDPDTASP